MFSITKINGQPNSSQIKKFICDYQSDILNLPTNTKLGIQVGGYASSNETCAIGSNAYCIETSENYILGNDDVWHLMSSNSSDSKIDLSNYLAKDNQMQYIPTSDYNPATKKYVDDNIGPGDDSSVKLLWSGALYSMERGIGINFSIPENYFFNNGKELIILINGFSNNFYDSYDQRDRAYELCVIGMCFGMDFYDEVYNAGGIYPGNSGNTSRYIYNSQLTCYNNTYSTISVNKVSDSRYAICNVTNESRRFCITSISAIIPK